MDKEISLVIEAKDNIAAAISALREANEEKYSVEILALEELQMNSL